MKRDRRGVPLAARLIVVVILMSADVPPRIVGFDMSEVTPYGLDWDGLTDEQKLVALSERKLGKKQVKLGVYLMAELNKEASEIVAILDAIREFNAGERGADTEGSKRVSKAEQIVVALEEHRDTDVEHGRNNPDWLTAFNEAISVAGRFV